MIYTTRKAVLSSLHEFSPTLRAKHHVVKLASGKWTRTLGAPGDVIDAIGCTHRAVNVRGREWQMIKTEENSDDR